MRKIWTWLKEFLNESVEDCYKNEFEGDLVNQYGWQAGRFLSSRSGEPVDFKPSDDRKSK